MSRAAKGARLWLRPAAHGKLAKWYVIDGARQFSTGCGPEDRAGADAALGRYLAGKYTVARRQRRLSEIPIADVLNVYLTDIVPTLATRQKAAARIVRLLAWWKDMRLDEVTGAACRQFAATRSPGAARRELQDLQAAINHHHREGLHREAVLVWIPSAGKARERWLTRGEMARLIWACWRAREVQEGAATSKRPLRHLARFIIFSIYTMSRPGDVLNASFKASSDRGYVDLDGRRYFRKPADKVETKKRQPPVPIGPRLGSHLRRWARDQSMVVEYNGGPIQSVKTAWARAVELSGLSGDVVPYSLRHSSITWAMSRGERVWDVAKQAGTSAEMIERHYGHFHPEFLAGVAEGRGSMTANKWAGTKRDERARDDTKKQAITKD
jgi:hypothetical protein